MPAGNEIRDWGVYESEMRKEYDFSAAERGRFYRKDALLRLPVYLDSKAMTFVAERARLRRTDISTIVNELIHEDMRLARTVK
jgi:hypothetical protein